MATLVQICLGWGEVHAPSKSFRQGYLDRLSKPFSNYFKTHPSNHELTLTNSNILTLQFVIIDAPKSQRRQTPVAVYHNDLSSWQKEYFVYFGH